MYYAKVDTRAVATVRDLSRTGMRVVDVGVTLEFDARFDGSTVIPADVVVRDCLPDDVDTVLDIAGSCFRYSRFHVDPDVPRTIAHRIKREWIANYVRGERGEQLLVARRDERLVGFLAMMSLHEADRRIRVIDLIGVDSAHQGQGVGRALVASFLDATAASEGRRVATQASNIPSLGLYQRFGFRVIRTGYVLHMHV
ncbi:MAG TPA: GNAT family N-acetyltransferase [Acidobacteriota bacterium]|nr:GNAT family N-acetyltransferase [Acidobacteriota bacterium]